LSIVKIKTLNNVRGLMKKEFMVKRIIRKAKCPFCNSYEYDILRTFTDGRWIDTYCRCEECGKTFTLECKAKKAYYRTELINK